MTFIKNILMVFLVLIISAAVFFYIVKDQGVKDNILKTTLELFGDELLAMYPEGGQKEIIKQKYDEFLQRTAQDEVSPEEIERVAAGILNFTTMDTKLPPQVIIDFLDESGNDSLFSDTLLVNGKSNVNIVMPPPGKRRFPFPPKRPKMKHWDRESREQMAERLKEVKDFHTEMQYLWENDSTLKDLQQQVFFDADSGLKIAIGIEMRDLIRQHDERIKQLHDLEKEQIIVWNQKNVDQKEIQAIKLALKHVPLVGKEIQAIVEMASLSDSLHFEFKIDSLDHFLEERLDELEKEYEKIETGPDEN